MSDNYCSTPGCGYPDGKPCIGCGHIVGPTVEHVEVITKQSAERQAMIETLRHELLQSQALVEKMREALDKLSRLGNEPLIGNSIGNRLAQDALTLLNSLMGKADK